ncbi:hypothetical protein H181DRAFT_04451 [Streptomyces sp. WMMB 714]|uniref:hypothetical protein n=1 Tax=Streptomyces sp. WMMB 714 TaxID=1286822 RepID=UPI000823BF5C|nr:hypothetical protein H181DRAFT_04451 [Streptomyces sp. WMMB 714]
MAAQGSLLGAGILLSSTDRDRLVAWYRSALEPLGAAGRSTCWRSGTTRTSASTGGTTSPEGPPSPDGT